MYVIVSVSSVLAKGLQMSKAARQCTLLALFLQCLARQVSPLESFVKGAVIMYVRVTNGLGENACKKMDRI